MKPQLRSVPKSDASREQIALEQIREENREAKWTPIADYGSAIQVDEILQKSARYAIEDKPIPWHRRVLRWLRGAS